MKGFCFLLAFVLLTGLFLTGCAVYPGKGKPCVSATTVNVGSGISVAEENAMAKALSVKAQEAQAILAAMERDGHPCYDCPPRTAQVTTSYTPAPTYTPEYTTPEPSYTTRDEPGASWVFRWEPAEAGYFWVITNPKYLNASPGAGQEVYFVGDGQGWYSKDYPMMYEMSPPRTKYMVKLPVAEFLGRNRCNYVIMDGSSGDGIWAEFGPSDDRTWVKQGDYDVVTKQYKHCIIFQVDVDSDGKTVVVPSE